MCRVCRRPQALKHCAPSSLGRTKYLGLLAHLPTRHIYNYDRAKTPKTNVPFQKPFNGRLALTKFANAEVPATKFEIITISFTLEESSVIYLLNQLKCKLGRKLRQLRTSIWINYHRTRCKVDEKTSPVCVSFSICVRFRRKNKQAARTLLVLCTTYKSGRRNAESGHWYTKTCGKGTKNLW